MHLQGCCEHYHNMIHDPNYILLDSKAKTKCNSLLTCGFRGEIAAELTGRSVLYVLNRSNEPMSNI